MGLLNDGYWWLVEQCRPNWQNESFKARKMANKEVHVEGVSFGVRDRAESRLILCSVILYDNHEIEWFKYVFDANGLPLYCFNQNDSKERL